MPETSLNPSQNTAHWATVEPRTDGRKRILLVEGDGFTRLVLLLRLRLAGFGVDFTSNGILGLGKLRSCHPDVLLVELNLCGLSGLELIKAARAEATFASKPIYVFTRANKLNRGTRRELDQLGITLVDKISVTREDLVQIFATTFLPPKPALEQRPAQAPTEPPASAITEVVLSGAIEELVAGVREQSELFGSDSETRVATGAELLSRVSSLASCAKAAGLANLGRQSKALENFLNHLCSTKEGYTEAVLNMVNRAVEVMSRIAAETKRPEQSPRRFAAVFVDESPYSSRAMEEALLNASFKPVCFEDPARAREYLASNRADLIIANLVLPEAHGLAVSDIRRLPYHVNTPVLFAPESAIHVLQREQLPTAAPRLDKTQILLAEVVLRSLNEVQSKGTSGALPGAARQSTVKPKAAILPSEDGLELFVKAPPRESSAALDASVENLAGKTNAVHPPQKFDHLFTAAGIPSEPIMRALPVTPGPDQEAELLALMPATSIDGIQIDQQPVQELPPSAGETESPQLPQPEPMPEDMAATEAFQAATAANSNEPISSENTSLEPQQNESAATRESAAAISDYWQVMNNQTQAAPVEYARQGDLQAAAAPDHQSNKREDLIARVCAAEMALYRAQSQIQQKDKELETLQNQLTQGEADKSQATSTATEPGAAEQKAQARCAELEDEIAALRQAFEGLNGNFGEQQASTDASKRAEELEQRLNQSAAELEKQKDEQQRVEGELRRQLEAANEARQQSEAARQQADTRFGQLEQELAALRKAQEEKTHKPQQEQKTGLQSSASEPWVGASARELEQLVRQGVADLARATAELAKERGERQRSQQRTAELNGRLQALHEDLSRTLKAQKEDLARISALEQHQEQTNQAFERATADLEQQQAECRLANEQLQNTKELNAQLRKDLSFFEEANKKFGGAREDLQNRLEANLNATRESETRLQKESAERQRLAESLEETKREVQTQARKREAVEQELQSTTKALQELEAKLHNEAAERQRLNQAQDSLQRNLLDGSERDLEFSKVQSALQLEQVERKRQESQLTRLRQKALDSAHAARALRTGLRRQVREPVDNLVHSTRSLLELELGEEQKKLAEAVLQDILLVQTCLREPAPAQTDAQDSDTSAETPTEE